MSMIQQQLLPKRSMEWHLVHREDNDGPFILEHPIQDQLFYIKSTGCCGRRIVSSGSDCKDSSDTKTTASQESVGTNDNKNNKRQKTTSNQTDKNTTTTATTNPNITSRAQEEEYWDIQQDISCSSNKDHYHCQSNPSSSTTTSSTSSCHMFRVSSRQVIPIYCKRKTISSFLSQAPSTPVAAAPQQVQPNNKARMEETLPILVSWDTITFRMMAMSQLRIPTTPAIAVQQYVLEIGSSTGNTSQVILKQSQYIHAWMGWDNSANMVQTVQSKIQQCTIHNPTMQRSCHKMDPLKDPQTATALVTDWLMNTTSITTIPNDVNPTTSQEQHLKTVKRRLTILIDIGGDRNIHAVCLLLHWALTSFSDHLDQIIIKSETLFTALQTNHIRVDNGWLEKQILIALRETIPTHPLQAGKRFTPDEQRIPICRYHNYHHEGCIKYRDAKCPHNHEHCHLCLGKGHIARNCHWIHCSFDQQK